MIVYVKCVGHQKYFTNARYYCYSFVGILCCLLVCVRNFAEFLIYVVGRELPIVLFSNA